MSFMQMTTSSRTASSIFANYAREIELHWKYKERQRKQFLFNSPQLQLRSHLVGWLKNISEKLKVSYRTIHLAVYILDTFMDNHSISKDRLGFVALVCLMLAAKFEELDSKIPKISELNKYDGYRYSSKDFISVEVMVLKFLDFGLTQPTIAHFAEYYTMVTIMPHDLKSVKFSFRRLADIACNMVAELLDICLKEVRFLQHPPSKVAAACILVTRKRLSLSPAWTPVLAEVTGYKEDSLNFCTNLLMCKIQQENVRRKQWVNSPDHGYISDAP
ncbi:cyclin-J isoform X1 [Homalodisca vitripennis]|uniref:cyclin-J isoform X1 n=2 Tax=Homalodisca vitripennis TaxID=197043 RepID=UPI001EEBE6FB|nr:cyclin-J isoform X1 [Homalodisca vitripennis]